MSTERVNTLIVGAGQAGLALSEHLTTHGVSHVVLERNRIAERWRSERWDALVANGPAWHDRFPSMTFSGVEPEGFATRDNIVDYFVAFAEQINAPVREGVEVTRVQRLGTRPGFLVETSSGPFEADSVVAATGAFQQPVTPDIVSASAGISQMHSRDYRHPEQIAPGAVLVVGAGSSGSQIADELQRAGHQVYLSVGPHERPPRSYRGRDFCWWLGVLGKWDMATPPEGSEHVTIAVSGARGGRTVDFREFATRGMILVGRTEHFDNGTLHFAPDVIENVANGDASLMALLDEADAYVDAYGMDLPEEPSARHIGADPDCLTQPIKSLDLAVSNISTIIWATGYVSDYGWLPAGALDNKGQPQHQRGVSTEPGIYFLGLPWQSRRGSSFIWGVWHDAKFVADQINIQKSYRAFHEAHPLPVD